jgi:hypothetical protein
MRMLERPGVERLVVRCSNANLLRGHRHDGKRRLHVQWNEILSGNDQLPGRPIRRSKQVGLLGHIGLRFPPGHLLAFLLHRVSRMLRWTKWITVSTGHHQLPRWAVWFAKHKLWCVGYELVQRKLLAVGFVIQHFLWVGLQRDEDRHNALHLSERIVPDRKHERLRLREWRKRLSDLHTSMGAAYHLLPRLVCGVSSMEARVRKGISNRLCGTQLHQERDIHGDVA